MDTIDTISVRFHDLLHIVQNSVLLSAGIGFVVLVVLLWRLRKHIRQNRLCEKRMFEIKK